MTRKIVIQSNELLRRTTLSNARWVFYVSLWPRKWLLSVSDPSECSSYTELNTADRASGSHRGRLLKCDKNDFPSQAKWYRFTGAAGTRMPTTPVAIHHCGTHAPGWLNGQHPKKEDGLVSRKVCFNWGNNLCRWHVFVSVRNCGNFLVYHLGRTPGCSFRYCGNNGHSKFSSPAVCRAVLWKCFVIECSKTKPKVYTKANQKKWEHLWEPMRTHNEFH